MADARFSRIQPASPPDYLGDSSVPQDLVLNAFVRQQIELISARYSGFVQHTWDLSSNGHQAALTTGLRAHHWDFNRQIVLSPRATFSYRPAWEKKYLFRLSAGFYHQPPFYRELRNAAGEINRDVKAQTSIHFVAGTDYDFMAWNRPFKLVAEVYYKLLNNLIPYEIDNVRIRYDAENHAKGYATGLDVRVNGEFVRGIESWASLSVMETRRISRMTSISMMPASASSRAIFPDQPTSGSVLDCSSRITSPESNL